MDHDAQKNGFSRPPEACCPQVKFCTARFAFHLLPLEEGSHFHVDVREQALAWREKRRSPTPLPPPPASLPWERGDKQNEQEIEEEIATTQQGEQTRGESDMRQRKMEPDRKDDTGHTRLESGRKWKMKGCAPSPRSASKAFGSQCSKVKVADEEVLPLAGGSQRDPLQLTNGCADANTQLHTQLTDKCF